MAAFGQMVLDNGRWRGVQILPSEWVDRFFVPTSGTNYGSTIWPYESIRYGSLWWRAKVKNRKVYFAWGHGGQFITLVPSLDLVVVTTAFNFIGDFTNNSWITEGGIMRLIARDVIPAVECGGKN